MTTTREQFLAILPNGPLLRADAAVVLCGEDADPRRQIAAHLVVSDGARNVVLSGGKSEPPRWQSAEDVAPELMGDGVAFNKIRLDTTSQNTREQAENVIDMAVDEGWKRLLLIASPYHSYRAFLTFLRVLRDRELDRKIQITILPASQVPWWQSPTGMDETRAELLDVDLAKVEEYGDHVSSYEDGLAYLEYWETHEPELEGVEIG